jgi:hypothetical protein
MAPPPRLAKWLLRIFSSRERDEGFLGDVEDFAASKKGNIFQSQSLYIENFLLIQYLKTGLVNS